MEAITLLFRKDIEKSCAYCTHSAKIDSDTLLCSKCGFVASYHRCWKFKYDPLRRVPVKPALQDFSKYTDEDFSL